MKINKILVPTDFSEEAGHAVDFACEIAQKVDAQVILLHIVDVPAEEGGASTNMLGGSVSGTSFGEAGDHGGNPFMLYMHKLMPGQVEAF
mgnify:CR=1 FL=1